MNLVTHGVNQESLTMTDTPEKRTAPVGLRLFPSIKEALERAAADDHRTMASMAEKIISDYLRDKGFLAK